MVVAEEAWVIALAVLVAAQIEEPADFALAEVVVRFASGSEGRPPATEAAGDIELDPFLEAVSREIGRPLLLQRVGSGGDLILALDASALAGHLESILKVRPGVRDAAALAPQTERPRPEPRAAVKVRLTADAPELAGQLSRELDLPIVERTLPGGEHLFEVDLRALTLDVIERLKGRPDVDYAQPNYAVSY